MVLRKRPAHRVAAELLIKVLRLGGDARYRTLVERLHRDVYKDGFVLDGIRFYPDPCSIGYAGHGTGPSAAELVRERGLSDLHVLDMCCGVGVVGLTMAARLRNEPEKRVRKLSFADISIFNLNSLERTLRRNPSEMWGNAETEMFLSDGLKGIEPANQFDLIVSNPPHFYTEDFTDWTLQSTVLGVMDAGWEFHKEFYASCHKYLRPNGEVWFLENHLAKPEEALTQIIRESPEVELTDVFDDRSEPRAFWMISRRRA